MSFTLYGCGVTTNDLTTSNNPYDTQVKVVGLEYDYISDISNFRENPVLIELAFSPVNMIEKIDYIFPEEVLVFTIIIEDPNYEFVSLQSIVFNEETIRANTDDAITETRDCGENICIDFPYIVKADVINYTVTQVKFAKANSETGFAIIDESSMNSLTLEIYTNSIYPYVHESVTLLNNWIQDMSYYSDYDAFTSNEWELLWEDFFVSRTLKIINLEDSPHFTDDDILNPDNTDAWMYATATEGILGMFALMPGIKICMHNGESVAISVPTFSNYYFEETYQDIYFFNEGNSIFVNILGYEVLVIEMGKRTRFAYLEESDYVLYTDE
jgi:hypothetical protein